MLFLSVFCLFCRVFKGSHSEKILDVFEVFLGVFEKNKEKKARAEGPKRNLNAARRKQFLLLNCFAITLTAGLVWVLFRPTFRAKSSGPF